MKRIFVPVLAALLGFVACAHTAGNRTRLADGSYHLSCKEPLANCLATLRDVCTRYGYDVLHAKEEKKHYGPSLWEAEYISSDAVIRCREPEPLLGGKSTAPPGSSSASAATPVAAGARCFPGTTQECLGPAACKGAQTCKGDGLGFGACDCGPAVTPIATPGSDAGPPPTWATPADGGTP